MKIWIYKNKITGNYFNWDKYVEYKHKNRHLPDYDISKSDSLNLKYADKFSEKEILHFNMYYRVSYSKEIKDIRKLKIQQLDDQNQNNQ